MPSDNVHHRITRRRFLQGASLAALAAACGQTGEGGGVATSPTAAGPTAAAEPTQQLSGSLRILMWSHFVPRHDDWFDPFAQEWGEQVGVDVTVDHISVADVPARIQSEIQAGSGHDLMQYIAPIPQFEESVEDMADVTEEAVNRHGEQLGLCRSSSYNPTTEKFFAYSPGWTPDPGDYLRSLWSGVDMPDGPTSWDDLLNGGAQILSQENVPVGIGMSEEIDSNMAARALMWSFGGSIQDENENVTLNTPEVVDAVEFMTQLYEQAMTDEVFAWTAASNNQGLISGELSYILNSISAWRTAQDANPETARDVYFVPALEGPAEALAAQHVMYNWIVPSFSDNVDNAKEFLLHYTDNFGQATYESELYDLPAFASTAPEVDQWLSEDPFVLEGDDATKLTILQDAPSWSSNVGHRGPANTAIGEVFGTNIIPNMMASAARGDASPQQAVEEAESQVNQVFDKWRQRGLIGGGSGGGST